MFEVMSDDPHPALSPEEWIQYGDDLQIMADWAADKRPFGPARRFTLEDKRHAVAAIALHNQPFGFTHDDEALLEGDAALLRAPGLRGRRRDSCADPPASPEDLRAAAAQGRGRGVGEAAGIAAIGCWLLAVSRRNGG